MGLAEQYKVVLSSKFGNEVAVFDYAADFDKFWFEGQNTIPAPEIAVAASTATKKALIIVWDGMPNDKFDNGKLLAKHLTPLDWVLAFSIKIISLDKVGDADFSIHIIDFTVKEFEDAYATCMRDQLLADMPWVKLYAPLIPAKSLSSGLGLDCSNVEHPVRYRRGYLHIIGVSSLLIKSFNGAWELNLDGKRLKDAVSETPLSALKAHGSQWAASIIQSRDHHDLNNIIGPDILLPTKSSYVGLKGAILRKLFWCDQPAGSGKFPIAWQHSPDDLLGKHFSVVIIDDCLDDGWDRFVCKLLGTNHSHIRAVSDVTGYERINGKHDTINIYGTTKVDAVIKKLQSTNFAKRDFQSSLLNKGKGAELVLLDLRLFSSLDEAKRYTTELVKIASQSCASGLAWIGFKPGELQEISDWCGGKKFDDDIRVADSALTLLPRLLALAFPLTPIILFSSTGQARLKEKLKPYRNVITGFEKPRVLSSPELVKVSLAMLHDALDQAMDILRLKLQLAMAQLCINKISEKRGTFTGYKTAHLEIYADETGNVDKGIFSALALCFYPKKREANMLQQEFFNQFKLPIGVIDVQKTIWARCGENDNNCLSKGNALYRPDEGINNLAEIDQVTAIVKPIIQNTCRWSAVTIGVPGVIAPNLDVRTPTLREFRDVAMDQALRFGLEFSLYALLPYLVGDNEGSPVSVNLHMPQRSCPVWVDDDPHYNTNTYLKSNVYAKKVSQAFSVSLSEKYDKKSRLQKVMFRTFESTERDDLTRKIKRGNSYFPLIRGWLSEWQNAGIHQITGIYATDLTKGTEEYLSLDEAQERRLFHDIADWVATGARNENVKRALSPIFPNWYRNYQITFNDANYLLRALKLAETQPIDDRTGRADCLRFILLNSAVARCTNLISENRSVEAVLLWALKDEIDYADGEDLFNVIFYQKRNALSDTINKDDIDANDQVLPVTDVVPESGQDMHAEVLADSEGKEITQTDEDSEPSEQPLLKEVPVIDFADLVWLRQRFPDGIELFVQKVTKHGSVLCKLPVPEGSDISHQCNSKIFVDKLRGKGISEPTKIFATLIKSDLSQLGLVDDDVLSMDYRNVLFDAKAVLLADGRWQTL